MRKPDHRGPDHTLVSAHIEPNDEEPKVYQVVDLRAYVKPEMDEELSDPSGGSAGGGGTICSCVPVEECVCDTVTYDPGGCPGNCLCVGAGGGLYWFPL